MTTPIRVAQWATGNIGTRALREVVRDPRLTLVGVLVYDPAKAGTDAGPLCGETPTGVVATTDREVIHALDVDCVLYMPRLVDVDDLVRLLERGVDVVTTCVELFDGGRALPEVDRDRIADACTRGGTSIFATGSSPGFITHVLPQALLMLQRRVDLVEIFEYANMSRRDSPHMLFEQIGFGTPMPDAPAAPRPVRTPPSVAAVADAAGKPAESWTFVNETAAAVHDTEVLAGRIAAGTVGGRRMVYAGQHAGIDIVRITYCWYLTPDLDPAWEVGATGWHVRVHGDAPMDVAMPFPVPVDDLAAFTPGYTANPPVNAIPYVVAARPGILDAADLPLVTPAGPTPDGG